MSPQTIAAAAIDYARRGWKPVPIGRKSKKPTDKGWQKRSFDPAQFNGNAQNVAVQLGAVSNGLADVDLDCTDAIGFATEFLPATGAIFGRRSKPCSHQLYVCDLHQTEDAAVIPYAEFTAGRAGQMIVELRIGANGKGATSVFPPSMHETGESVEWVHDCEPARVGGADLKRAVGRLAVAVLLRRHYPGQGSRHRGAAVLGGVLARAGWSKDDISHVVEVVARAAGDDEVRDRVEAAASAVDVKANGEHVSGLTQFGDLWGEAAATTLDKWGLRAATRKGGAPELIINGSDPTASAKDLATLIAKRNDFLFNGNAPVRIADETGWLPRALEVTTEMVRVLAHEICTPTKVRTRKGAAERIPVPLSNDIAQLYLHGLEGSWGLKPFHGIVTAPLLSDDGGIRIASGYDAQSGLWCHGLPHITIPAEPAKDDAERALRKLRGRFRTFPFADAARLSDPDLGVEAVDLTKPAGLDESSFLVALLTAVCRQSLDLAPGFLCDAPNFSGAGTGKGLLVKAICVIASGVRPSAFTSGHDAEEFDKRLTAALIEAHPAVFLDNFNSKDLSSDILASVLTESPAVVRPMGHTKTVPLHTRTFIGITGNSVQIAEDMARRLLNTHLDAHMENPEQRKFTPGFLDRIFVDRANLLAAALTIWRWGRQNKPEPGKPLGSYEVWAQWCRDPLLALGMRDPVDRIAEIKAADPKRRALVAIFDLWSVVHGNLIIKANDLGQEVIQAIDDKATVRADGSLQYSRQRVAAFLARHVNTRVGGYALTKIMLGPPSKEVAYYKLMRDHKTTRGTLP
jgi:hypothetical protein